MEVTARTTHDNAMRRSAHDNVRRRSAYDDYMRPFDSYELKRRALDAEMLERLGKLDESWPDDPAVPELACELAVRHGISAHTAGERIRIARALRQLPHIARAHREGHLSWDQLRWVSRFATPETDEAWARRAPSMRPLALRQESIRQRRVTRLRDHQDEALRSFSMEWDEEHRLLSVYGTLVGGKAAAFEVAVKKAAQEVTIEDDVDDRQGARQAEALVGLVTSSGGRTRPATLVVHADAEVLAPTTDEDIDEAPTHPTGEPTDEPTGGKRLLAETSSGVQLSHDAVRRIACDARVRIALERDGSPVGVVTTGRGVTESQLELLWFRDKHCTFPGCERTWFVEAHHIRHWADGGRTILENLTLLCSSHHRKLHKGRWTIRGRPGIDLRFHDPGRSREILAA